jgi:hypothetical protein
MPQRGAGQATNLCPANLNDRRMMLADSDQQFVLFQVFHGENSLGWRFHTRFCRKRPRMPRRTCTMNSNAIVSPRKVGRANGGFLTMADCF